MYQIDECLSEAVLHEKRSKSINYSKPLDVGKRKLNIGYSNLLLCDRSFQLEK